MTEEVRKKYVPTTLEKYLVVWIEQQYWERKTSREKLPDVEELSKKFNTDQAQVLYSLGTVWVHKQLNDRGLPVGKVLREILRGFSKDTVNRVLLIEGSEGDEILLPDDMISPKQSLVASLVLNPQDKRTIREKLKQIGVKASEYNGWMNDDNFVKYMRDKAKAIFDAADSAAFIGFTKLLENADKESIKLYFEMKGIYNPKLSVDINIQGLVIQLVEIVTKHVQDPDTLVAIANEVDRLMGQIEGQVGAIQQHATSGDDLLRLQQGSERNKAVEVQGGRKVNQFVEHGTGERALDAKILDGI